MPKKSNSIQQNSYGTEASSEIKNERDKAFEMVENMKTAFLRFKSEHQNL